MAEGHPHIHRKQLLHPFDGIFLNFVENDFIVKNPQPIPLNKNPLENNTNIN